ncbi:MAG TPA: MauE/DoxX family redox-associated membrane protein [Nitrospiraceae bacterium]|nr:MauE/DoxX family redox-associated membrane protein [Nitrospiraceae bacterium]
MPALQQIIGDPHFLILSRTIIGVLLLSAGILKVLKGRLHFVDVVKGYELLPLPAVRVVARCLPWTEMVVGLCLLLGVLMSVSALLASGIFLLFAGAVTINLLRGRRHIACGCFGSTADEGLNWSIVVRNTILASVSLLMAGTASPLAWISPFPPKPADLISLSSGEIIVTAFLGGAGLALWSLSRLIVWLWRLPDLSRPRRP